MVKVKGTITQHFELDEQDLILAFFQLYKKFRGKSDYAATESGWTKMGLGKIDHIEYDEEARIVNSVVNTMLEQLNGVVNDIP